ncbi:S66 peptidase family protein [Clostridium sp.]|uniref:S66 family peptidase n=1 Tax=Clostridium sp. TaxID=1506 RepID=UPI003992E463
MSSLLKENDKVAFFASSNGLSPLLKSNIFSLKKLFNSLGLEVVYGNELFYEEKNSPFNETAIIKAKSLENLFSDKSIKAIFDISGGDLSNGLLSYINFDIIKKNPKPFFGYSDLSTVLNALYKKCGFPTFHYQIKHLINNPNSEKQIKLFKDSILGEKNDLFKFKYKFIQGNSMKGIVVGGNIRCLLKLAGTPFMPDFNNKILFLEGYSGNPAKIYTFLHQYKQLGAFNNLKGILLGTFTEMEENNYSPTVEKMLLDILQNKSITIAKTLELGHGVDSKCITIGGALSLK